MDSTQEIVASFKDSCDNFRDQVKTLCAGLDQFKTLQQASEVVDGENRGETLANLTLAFRHLEDAAMRIGKAIQSHDGGQSPLGGPATPVDEKLAPAEVEKEELATEKDEE